MALYKKYRPQSLADIIGNPIVIDRLRLAIESPARNNASLYTGLAGTGKTSIARIQAKYRMGVGSTDELGALWGYREICAADMGGVDYVREIKRQISSGFRMPRVFFFDEGSWLTEEAQGVLLKAVEDAPADTHFILCTSIPGKLSGALKSRFSHYHLEPLTPEEMVGLIAKIATLEGAVVCPEARDEIARLSGGLPRAALVMLEEIISLPVDKQLGALRTETIETEQQRDRGQNRKGPYPAGVLNYAQQIRGGGFKTKAAWLNSIESTTCSSAELLQREFAPLKMYISPFMHSGALIMIFAAAGSGKTFFMLFLMILLTRLNGKGFSIGPLTVVESCGILIIDGEMPPRLLKNRISMIAGPMGDEDPENLLEILTSDDLCSTRHPRINIALEECRDGIYTYLEKNRHIKILGLDNLSSLMPGVSENSKSAFDAVNQWLISLRTLGVCVIIVHHSNKAGGYRGHSGRIDNLDTVIGLKSLNGSDELSFTAEFIKFRSGKKGEGQSFGLEAVPHPDNPEWLLWKEVPFDSLKDIEMRDEQIMVALLAGGKTQEAIGKMYGVRQPTVSNVKKMAVEKGLLTAKGQVTDLGEEFLRKYDSGCVE